MCIRSDLPRGSTGHLGIVLNSTIYCGGDGCKSKNTPSVLQADGCAGSEACSLPWGEHLLLAYGGHRCFPVPFCRLDHPFAG